MATAKTPHELNIIAGLEVSPSQFGQLDTEHRDMRTGVGKDISVRCPSPEIQALSVVNNVIDNERRNHGGSSREGFFWPEHERYVVKAGSWLIDERKRFRDSGWCVQKVNVIDGVNCRRDAAVLYSWPELPTDNSLPCGIKDKVLLEVLAKQYEGPLNGFQGFPTDSYRTSGIVRLIPHPIRKELHTASLSASSMSQFNHSSVLSAGSFGQMARIDASGLHFTPLQTNKSSRNRTDASSGTHPSDGRALKNIHLMFNFVELLFGGWLGCFYGVDNLGSLDWRVTLRGFCALLGGVGLFVYGGVNIVNRISHTQTVSQKLLTPYDITYYTNCMANVLSADKQIAIISSLCEGSSIRSIERITGVHRDTIMRLGVRVGQGCTALMDRKMRNLDCHRLEMDEIWGYVGKKEKHLRAGDDPQLGNVWTYCAIDAETKLVPAFHVARERNLAETTAFVSDVADRLKNRVQISTDGLAAYVDAIETSFGRHNVDYGQVIKTYGTEESVDAQRRYSAPKIKESEKKAVLGYPDWDFVSTSYVERLNATTRLHMKRLARLTHAFSKKRENFTAAVGLHFAYYNFVRRHNTLRCTPAMEAGVEKSFWSVGELLEASA